MASLAEAARICGGEFTAMGAEDDVDATVRVRRPELVAARLKEQLGDLWTEVGALFVPAVVARFRSHRSRLAADARGPSIGQVPLVRAA